MKRLSMQKLFIQGGPGSGFHDHRGRPGFVGGSAKEKTFPTMTSLRGGKGNEGYHRERVENIVRKLGYPIEKVESTTDEGYAFQVNGENYRAGAEYNPRTGIIKIFDIDEKTDVQMEGILAHEVQHSRWQAYKETYQRQFIEVQKSIRSSENKEDWLIRADGEIRNPKDKDRLWAYDIHESFLTYGSKRWERLRKSDGISAYSKSYWKQAEISRSVYDYDRAVDETLAEIARINTGHARQGDKKSIRPIWQSLFNKVHKKTKQNQLLFLFGGAGSGHHGHEGRPGMVGGSKKEGGSETVYDPDTGETLKGIKDKDGYIRNADPLTVYWGTSASPKNVTDLAGGDTKTYGKSHSGGNTYVTTDYDAAQAFAEASSQRTGKNARVYKFTLQPNEGWLPYSGPNKSDGIELAVKVSKDRVIPYAGTLESGEWFEY